jgi:hypothetical protein
LYVPALAIVKEVVLSVPADGSRFGVAPVQLVAKITLSPDTTVPVNLIVVATPAVVVATSIAVITLFAVAAFTVNDIPVCSIASLFPFLR